MEGSTSLGGTNPTKRAKPTPTRNPATAAEFHPNLRAEDSAESATTSEGVAPEAATAAPTDAKEATNVTIEQHYLVPLIYKYIMHLILSPSKGPVTYGRSLESDGRKRKRICRDLIEQGYIEPTGDQEGKEAHRAFIITSKAYDELEAQEPDITGQWVSQSLYTKERDDNKKIIKSRRTHADIYSSYYHIQPGISLSRAYDHRRSDRWGLGLPQMKWLIETGLPTGQCFMMDLLEHSSYGRESTEMIMEGREVRYDYLPIKRDTEEKRHTRLTISTQGIMDAWKLALDEAHFDHLLRANVKWGLGKVFPSLTKDECAAVVSGGGPRWGLGGNDPASSGDIGAWYYEWWSKGVGTIIDKIERMKFKLDSLNKVLLLIEESGGMAAFMARYRAELQIEIDKPDEEEADEKEAEKANAEA